MPIIGRPIIGHCVIGASLTVIHTTLSGLEPTTSRLLVQRATSSATDSPVVLINVVVRMYVARSHSYRPVACAHTQSYSLRVQ